MTIYDIIISDEEQGIELISFVENPAIQTDFITLSEEQEIVYLRAEKRIVTTPILIPEQLIYRDNRKYGKHYIKFSSDMIEKISNKYFKDGNIFKYNLEHTDKIDGIYLCESFIVNRKRNINPPIEFKDLPDGTWIASFKVDNPKLWEQIKLGKFKGVSIEGILEYKLSIEEEDVELNEIKEIYKQLSKIK